MKILTQKSPNKFYFFEINNTLRLQDTYQFLKAALQKLVFQYAEKNYFPYLKKGLHEGRHILSMKIVNFILYLNNKKEIFHLVFVLM